MWPEWATDTRVVILMWATIGMVALVVGFRRRRQSSTIDRQIAVVSTAIGAILVILGFQAARYTVLQQRAIAGRTGIDPATNEVVANPRTASSDLTRPRGAILAADGTPIAWSERTGDIFTRFYGDATLAPVTGYFSPLLYGKAGLEASWDAALTGEGGRSLPDQIAGSLGIGDRGPLDLILTIEPEIQTEAMRLLDGMIGAAIVLEPASGEILALASNPSVDPVPLAAVTGQQVPAARAAWQRLLEDPARPLVRRATEGLYPPGSTFKIVTAAAGLGTGIVEPDSVFEDPGYLDVDGRRIVEANRPDDSVSQWTLIEGFVYSLNVVFAQVGLQVGRVELERAARAFGIGSAIEFDEPVAAGQLASSETFLDQPVALADTAFGQGELLVTPLHMAMVAAAVANGGELVRPTLVRQLRSTSGSPVSTIDRKVTGRAIDAQTAQILQDMMVDAVEWGYAGGAAVPGYRVGGKTGTAESGTDVPHGWFVGFAGADTPSIVVAILVEHGGEGGGIPAQAGARLMELALRLRGD